MIRFVWKHFLRHWRLHVLVLGAVSLASGLLAAVPMMAAVIGGQSLSQSLGEARASIRNIQIESDSLNRRLTGAHNEEVQAALGPFIRDTVEIRDAALVAEQNIYRVGGTREGIGEFLRLRFRSFTNLDRDAQLMEGEWPSALIGIAPQGNRVVEIAVGVEAAQRMGLQVGDQFSVLTQGEPLNSEQSHFFAQVVGILAPASPSAEVWWDDPDQTLFSLLREQVTINLQRIVLSVFISPEALEKQIPEHRHYWHLFVNSQMISISNADSFNNSIVRLSSRLGTMSATLKSGLPDLLNTFAVERARAQVSLLLLTAQSLLAVLYTLFLIGAMWLDLTRFEVAILVGRGFARGQVTLLFAVEAVLLSLGVALPFGPIAAHTLFQLWSRATGDEVLAIIPEEASQLAGAAVVIGAAAFVVLLYRGTRGNMIDWQRQRARPELTTRRRRLAVDLFLLIIGGLAFWQLTEIRSAANQDAGIATADPALLLGPSVLLLAIGLLLHRLFPLLIGLLRWLSRGAKGFVLPLGLTRLSRERTGPVQLILLISLSAALTLFATAFDNSIRARQREISRYAIGADITIRQPREAEVAAEDQDRVMSLPGIMASSPVYRGNTRPSGRSYSALNLLAVDPDSLAQVARYPSGISPVSMSVVAQILRSQDNESGPLPLILSNDAAAGEARPGEQLLLSIGPHEVAFEVKGIIGEFPTLDKPFMLTNLTELEKRINLNSSIMRILGERELWLATDLNRHAQLVAILNAQTREEVGLATYQAGRLIGDAQAKLSVYEADVSARLATAAFNLNAVVLVTLSSAAFLLVQISAARRRTVEFGLLRLIGFSPSQMALLLSVEGLIVLLVGLMAGMGIGYELANMMRPYLSLTLMQGLGGWAVDQIVINWAELGRLFMFQALFYGAGMIGLIVVLRRSQLHQVLRQVEE